jgi:hypothetical protein
MKEPPVPWHSEEILGVDAAVRTLKRLVPRLGPFQCIVVQPRAGTKLMLFQKPWVGILVSGKLSGKEVSQLTEIGDRLGLIVSPSIPSEDGSRGFSFCPSTEGWDSAEHSRHFLEVFCDASSKIKVDGVNPKVNTVTPPPSKGQSEN